MNLNNFAHPVCTPIIHTTIPVPTEPPTHTVTPIPPLIPQGQTWRFYYFAGSQRIAMRYKYGSSVNEYGFLLSDHLNSTTIIVSSTGVQAGKLLYRAFGEERPISGTMPTNYRYTGQLAQPEVGFITKRMKNKPPTHCRSRCALLWINDTCFFHFPHIS